MVDVARVKRYGVGFGISILTWWFGLPIGWSLGEEMYRETRDSLKHRVVYYDVWGRRRTFPREKES